jgi:uncharacterized protein
MQEKTRYGPAGEKGRGLFATGPFRMGEEITRAPVILIEAGSLAGTPVENYCFYWSETEEAVAFGVVQMANHSVTPNSSLTTSPESLEIILTAIKNIAVGEEITYDYDCELWFEPSGGKAV